MALVPLPGCEEAESCLELAVVERREESRLES